MIQKFLNAKHWQLFLFTFGIPLLFQIVIMGSILISILSESMPNPSVLFSFVTVFPIMMFLFAGVLFGWFWSVAIGLQSKLPEGITMNITMFKTLLFIPLAYIVLFSIFFLVSVPVFIDNPLTFLVLIPLHLLSMFCMFYTLYFVAKTIKTVELQREVSFSDFAGEFFMIWFYPFGIWVLQPKINKMVEE